MSENIINQREKNNCLMQVPFNSAVDLNIFREIYMRQFVLHHTRQSLSSRVKKNYEKIL